MRAHDLRTAARLLPVAALLLAGCGGPVLFAELEMPAIGVTLPEGNFTPIYLPPADPSFEFTVDLGGSVPTLADPNVDFQLKLTRMTMTLSTAGAFSTFNGVDEITLSVTPPAGSPLAPLQILHWLNPTPGAGDLSTITVTSDADQDLKPYLSAGALTVKATYHGSVSPTDVWTATIAAEFWALVSIDYGSLLGI
jgi:hypothetical protein